MRHNTLTSQEIKQSNSNVRPRQDDGKNFPSTLPANELVLLNTDKIANFNEVKNLVNKHLTATDTGQPLIEATRIIYYIDFPARAVSIGQQICRAHKGAEIKIAWSETNKEVKVYVDFINFAK